MRYEVQDTNGTWHEVSEVQYIAYRLDGVPVRATPTSEAEHG